MSLPVLVAMVVVGIAAVVAAVHFSGGSAVARLSGAEQALRRFAVDYPEMTARTVLLTDDGATAFLLLESGSVGIVQRIGDKFLTRMVSSGDVLALGAPDQRTVSLRLRDFTWKGGEFRFADAEAASAVGAAFSGPVSRNSAREQA